MTEEAHSDNAVLGSAPPAAARFTRQTLLGCIGIAAILALPGVLFLPLESWKLPGWVLATVLLAAMASLVAGMALVLRVPSSSEALSEWQPLTRRGRSPILEQPARLGNRLSFVVLACLFAGIVGGVSLFISSPRDDFWVGFSFAAGWLLILYAGGVMTRYVPAPGLTWVRTFIVGRIPLGAIPAFVCGFVVTGWSMLVAEGRGLAWAPLGIGGIILAPVLAGAFLRLSRR